MRRFRVGRRRNWYEPEDLGPEQDVRDARDPERRFFVYVLSTRYGHYVGHSARPQARLREHLGDTGSPVAGGDPRLIWVSRPFRTRQDAAGFEAALKALRQRRTTRFAEIVGVEPEPFRRPYGQFARADALRGEPHLNTGVILLLAAMALVCALVLVLAATS